jgi:hypothetical protein
MREHFSCRMVPALHIPFGEALTWRLRWPKPGLGFEVFRGAD